MQNKLFQRSLFILILLCISYSFVVAAYEAQFKLSKDQADRIDAAIDLTRTFINIFPTPDSVRTILDTGLKSTGTTVDVSYGLLVLSAFSELEFIDMVVSQRYKRESTQYFNRILDEHANLFGYYRGMGFDLPRVLSRGIEGPFSALTLNTFAITNDVISALTSLNVLDKTMRYNALWVYFDYRRYNEPHETAWEDAKTQIGIASADRVTELRFAELWDKWGPYTDSRGVTEEAKRKFKEEMQQVALEASAVYAENQQDKQPSLFAKIVSAIRTFAGKTGAKIQDMGETIARLVNRGGGAGVSLHAPEDKEILQGEALSPLPQPSKTSQRSEPEEENEKSPVMRNLAQQDNNSDRFDRTDQEALPPETAQVESELDETAGATTGSSAKTEETEVPNTAQSCAFDSKALVQQDAVVFNEIAWMGNSESPNKEWIELKNISSNLINLAGWQLLDKTEDIKLVFSDISLNPKGLLVLERSVDYKGAMNNTNEALFLLDSLCVLRDKVLADEEWPAGDNDTKRTMERTSDLGWQTSENEGGTPRLANSRGYSASAPPVGGGGTAGGGFLPSYPKILISEIQIEGQTSKDEFVELYNPNDSDVNLDDWKLAKKTSTGNESNLVSSSAFEGIIKSKSYFLIVPQANDDGTANYKGNASPDLYYSGKTYSFAKDNTILLYNPLEQISDKVGFGTAGDFEGNAAPNHAAGKSLARKYNNGYQDSDNNAQDFEEQSPTPKAINQSEQSSQSDTTPPTVAFQSLAPQQTDVSFSLAWTASDSGGDAAASGIDNFYMQYAVSPSADGVFLQHESGGALTNWQTGAAGELVLALDSTTLSVSGAQDGLEYIFSLKARDKALNESSVATSSTTVNLAKTVVINEIAWMGTKYSFSDEWIELFNNTQDTISLVGWKFKSSDGNGPEITLTNTISGKSFYLIERTNDLPTSEPADLTGSFGNGLSNATCEVLSLYDANGVLFDQTSCKSDGSWPAGSASPNYISMERINPQTSGGDTANWASNNLITHNGRAADGTTFINGTPRQTNSVSKTETQFSDLRLSEFDSITLTKLGSPYRTTSSFTIPKNKTLIVEPGVTMQFDSGTSSITIQGTLKAIGASDKQIVFTDGPGGDAIWCGMTFTPTSTSSELDYITIEKATGCGDQALLRMMMVDGTDISLKHATMTNGDSHRKIYLKNSNSLIDGVTISGTNKPNDPDAAGIVIEGGSPTIKNSTFSSNTTGIWNRFPSGIPTIQANTFTNNTYAIKLTSSAATVSGNTASGNTYNGIFVEGAATQNLTWQADAIPYIMNTFTVQTGKTLTLQVGIAMKFTNQPNSNPNLRVEGTLITQGVSGNPVVFGPLANGGSWKRISFEPSSTGSSLTYTTMQYGGNSNLNDEAALYISQSSVAVNNVRIENSFKGAVRLNVGNITGSQLALKDNGFTFYITGGCPSSLTQVTIEGTGAPHIDSEQCTF